LEVEAMKAKEQKKPIRIYADGAGAGPDGKGSGFAWVNEESREKHIERVPSLTNNMAEYRAVISALKSVSRKCSVELITDSLLVVSQLRGEYRIRDPKLEKLATEVKTLADQKQLTLTLRWVPRQENLAGKLL
jgi:ribonuclease HI